MNRTSFGKLFGYFTLATLTLIFLYVIFNPSKVRYGLVDWYRRSQYEPTAEVVQIRENIMLTEDGVSLFNATQPRLLDKTNFATACPSAEQANVLGCYAGDLTYLLNVDDVVLDNVEEVTAVHELLHGVWARMENDERDELTEELMSVYASTTDQRLIDLVKSYEVSNVDNDEDLIPNELHSILATEVEKLTPTLESHYEQYLADRQEIVRLFNSYNAEFERRELRVETLQDQLATLRTRIDNLNKDIDALSAENDAVVAEINVLRGQGKTQESNALIPRQNALVAAIQSKVNQVNGLIDNYNRKVQENNELAFELNQLAESLNTRSQ